MHPNFDVDCIDSFWDMEEQSMRRKERKKQKVNCNIFILYSNVQILQTHITQSTRSTQWAQTSLAKADHYSHMPTVKILRLGGERLTPPPKKKNKSFGSLTCTTIWLFYSHYGVFGWFILLIYSLQKVPRSLKFSSALKIWCWFYWQFLRYGRAIDAAERKKERKKEERTRKLHLQANVAKKVIILHNPSYRL